MDTCKNEKRKVPGSDVRFLGGKGKCSLFGRKVGRRHVYYMDIYIEGGKRKRISTGETSVIAATTRMKAEIAKLERVTDTESVAFGDFIERYLNLPTKKKAAPVDGRRNRQWNFKKLVESLGGEWQRDNATGLYHFSGGPALSMMTPVSLEAYFAKRSQEVSPGSMNRELSCLKGLFKKAKKQKLVKENPTEDIEFHSEVGRERKRFLAVDEVNALIAKSEKPLKQFLTILAHTGARPGEIRFARWRDVRAHAEQSEIVVGRSKNGEGRILTLSGVAKNALDEMCSPKVALGDFIFPSTSSKDGAQPYDFKYPFQRAVKAAGLNRPGEEKLVPYHLRHFFISTLSRTGAVDMYGSMDLAGHKDHRSHQRYKHLYSSQRRQAVNAVEKLIGGAIVTKIVTQAPKGKIEVCGEVANSNNDKY